MLFVCCVFVNLREIVGMKTGRDEKNWENKTETISHKRTKKTKCTDNTTSKQVLFLYFWLLYAGTFRNVAPSSVTGASVCSDLIDSMRCGVPCAFISLVSSSNFNCQRWC